MESHHPDIAGRTAPSFSSHVRLVDATDEAMKPENLILGNIIGLLLFLAPLENGGRKRTNIHRWEKK